MTNAILGLLLTLHIAIVPVFMPKLSGIHDAQEQVSAAPRWHYIVQTGELEQSDGAMLIFRSRMP